MAKQEKGEKANLYLLAIVAIVAVVGIVVMILNSAGSTSLSSSDYSGQAYKLGTTSGLSVNKVSTAKASVGTGVAGKNCGSNDCGVCTEAQGVCSCPICTSG